MLRNLRNGRRLVSIAIILAREDALFIFRELGIAPAVASIAQYIFGRRKKGVREGERLATALEKLGPTFIKLGQALSTRSDLIGEELAMDLSRLRDDLPPFPSAIARQIIEEELEGPLGAFFQHFEGEPVAAASIAQVHKAITNDGHDVAVKILRPDIEKAFARDLDLFEWIAELLERNIERSRRLKPMEVMRTFRESVFFELDLRFEAAAATELTENMKRHDTGLRIPVIDWSMTSKRVLTMEWVDGISFNDIEAIKASGHDTDRILQKAADSLFYQVFHDGFFHADLHPGNLFLDKNGDIVVVDFGIMGRLDIHSRMYIAEILRGFLEEDYQHVADVHFRAGYVPPSKSREAFRQACMAVAKPIMGRPLNEISVAKLLGQMFAIATEFEMETQPQLLLMQKTMMLTEGMGRMLNPKLNTWELSRPLIERWATEQFGASGKMKEALREGAENIRKLPQIMRDVETMIGHFSDPAGIRLHPASIEKLYLQRKQQHRQWLSLGWIGVGIATLACALLILQ
ncbi:MAG: 2-polyprenylphenol 6-hydroxylase [Alphaproteobacteria bacterium]